MKKLTVLLSIFISSTCSAFTMEDIYNNLDVTTFNSSFIKRVPIKDIHFSDVVDLPKPVITDSKILIEDDTWVYSIEVIKENKRGIHICFTDRAKEGRYNVQKPMVIRKYGDTYVALLLRSNVCESAAS